jgi:hypothetical protein
MLPYLNEISEKFAALVNCTVFVFRSSEKVALSLALTHLEGKRTAVIIAVS